MNFVHYIPYLIFYIILGLFAASRRDNRLTAFVIFVVSSFFIGFRFETGFDWTVYKEEFLMLKSEQISISSILTYSEYFNHEFGYVALVTILSKILFDYEQFQFLVYSAFFVSIIHISNSFKSKSFSLSIFIIVSFLLFTLIMSTMRQCVAITAINFAISYYIRRKIAKSLLFSLLAITFQVSSAIYIVIFAASVILKFKGGITNFLYAALGAIFVSALINFLPVLDISIISKIYIYLDRDFASNIYEQIFFVTINAAALLHSIMMMKISGERIQYIYRFVVIMSVISIALLPINTLRNRIFYENIIIYSLILTNSPFRIQIFKYAVAALGFVSFASNFVKQSSIAFLPYQNYIVFSITGQRGDGYARQLLIYERQREVAQ